MKRATAVRSCLCLLALTFARCSASHGLTDAGSDAEGGVDAAEPEPPPCTGGRSLEMLPFVLPVESGAVPAVVPLRAIPTAGGFAVLVFQNWVAGACCLGGVRRLLLFREDGTATQNFEIRRDEESRSATADVAEIDGALWVVGLDRPSDTDVEIWLARVDAASGRMTRATLEAGADPARSIDGLVLFSATEGADLYLLRSGQLTRHRVSGDALSEGQVLGPAFDPSSRVTGVREGGRTCLVVRERPTGRLTLVELDGDTVVEERMLLERGANFNPPVEARGSACVAAFFEPSVERPTEGAVRLTDREGAATGWYGTAPSGLDLDGEHLLIATYDPDWPGQTALFALRLGPDRCRVGAPTRFDAQSTGFLPLGCLTGVLTPTERFVFISNLTAPGELALARLAP